MPSESKFKQRVLKAVCLVPFGQVASYGQIALMVGVPRAARQVGWILNGTEEDFVSGQNSAPWWRIVNNQGRISIKGTKYNDAAVQKKLLEGEGLKIKKDLTFDIELYRFHPSLEQLKELGLDDDYVSELLVLV